MNTTRGDHRGKTIRGKPGRTLGERGHEEVTRSLGDRQNPKRDDLSTAKPPCAYFHLSVIINESIPQQKNYLHKTLNS